MENKKYYQIEHILPHRYPFLFLDKIVAIEPGKKGVGVRNFTVNDFFFNSSTIVPSTLCQMLIIEALSQTAAVVSNSSEGSEDISSSKEGFIAGIDNFSFFQNPMPGDQLYLHVELLGHYGNLHKFNAWVIVDGKEVARGELTFAIQQ